MSDVRVYCGNCGKVLWEGNLIDWGVQLSNPMPPRWLVDATERHPKEKIMVKYPNRTVPLMLGINTIFKSHKETT